MLNDHLKDKYKPEDRVIAKSLEHINLIGVDHSAVNLIEHIHQYESMEADGVEDKSIGWTSSFWVSQWSKDEVEGLIEENKGSEVHEDNHYKKLIGSLNKNLSPHSWKNNLIVSSDSLRLAVVGLIWFSSNCDGTKDIHDQVGPEHLNNIERGMSESSSTKNSDGANNDVDGHLELNELSNVVKDGSTPLDSSADGNEIVIKDYKIRVVFGYFTAGTHAETNIGSLEGLSISNRLASHSNKTVLLLDTRNQDEFMESSSSGNNLQSLFDSLEFLIISKLDDPFVILG